MPHGDLTAHPSRLHDPPHYGPRKEREVLRLTNITVERTRSNANRLSKRFTKFITNFTGQVRVPHDLLSRERSASPTDQVEGERALHVGQIPED